MSNTSNLLKMENSNTININTPKNKKEEAQQGKKVDTQTKMNRPSTLRIVQSSAGRLVKDRKGRL